MNIMSIGMSEEIEFKMDPFHLTLEELEYELNLRLNPTQVQVEWNAKAKQLKECVRFPISNRLSDWVEVSIELYKCRNQIREISEAIREASMYASSDFWKRLASCLVHYRERLKRIDIKRFSVGRLYLAHSHTELTVEVTANIREVRCWLRSFSLEALHVQAQMNNANKESPCASPSIDSNVVLTTTPHSLTTGLDNCDSEQTHQETINSTENTNQLKITDKENRWAHNLDFTDKSLNRVTQIPIPSVKKDTVQRKVVIDPESIEIHDEIAATMRMGKCQTGNQVRALKSGSSSVVLPNTMPRPPFSDNFSISRRLNRIDNQLNRANNWRQSSHIQYQTGLFPEWPKSMSDWNEQNLTNTPERQTLRQTKSNIRNSKNE